MTEIPPPFCPKCNKYAKNKCSFSLIHDISIDDFDLAEVLISVFVQDHVLAGDRYREMLAVTAVDSIFSLGQSEINDAP